MATMTVEEERVAGAEVVDDGDPGGDEMTVTGEAPQLSFEVGGDTPTTSSLRLVGGKIDIEGQFKKGERVVLRVECEVREVSFRNEVDKATGQTIGCERRQKASITGVQRIDE